MSIRLFVACVLCCAAAYRLARWNHLLLKDSAFLDRWFGGPGAENREIAVQAAWIKVLGYVGVAVALVAREVSA